MQYEQAIYFVTLGMGCFGVRSFGRSMQHVSGMGRGQNMLGS